MSAAEQVDVWLLPLAADAAQQAQLRALLTPAELHRADTRTDPADRRRFVTAHGLTRAVLARYVRAEPGALRWRIGRHGKPGPVGDARAVHWNLSHSGEFALLAVSAAHPVGVDLQQLRADADVLALARRFLSAGEHAGVAALRREEDRRAAYYQALSRKEACAKAVGGRLLDLLGTAPDRGGRMRAPGGLPGAPVWRISDLAAPVGCVAALATPADRPRRIRRLQWHWPDAAAAHPGLLPSPLRALPLQASPLLPSPPRPKAER